MAELTALESKIGEVLGLAMAAQDATQKVSKLVAEEGDHEDLCETLNRMAKEAKETEERTTDLASELEGKKTAIVEKARETKREASEMMSTYLGDDATSRKRWRARSSSRRTRTRTSRRNPASAVQNGACV